MKWEDLGSVVDDAWEAFFTQLKATGCIDTVKLEDLLDTKDVFYAVTCAVSEATTLEPEE